MAEETRGSITIYFDKRKHGDIKGALTVFVEDTEDMDGGSSTMSSVGRQALIRGLKVLLKERGLPVERYFLARKK